MKDLSPILIKIALLILEKHSTKSKNLSPKFMSEILWNLSTNKCYDKFVLKKMEKMVISNIHLLNDIDLTQCFYSYCIFTQIGNKKEFKNVLDLLAERMNIYQKKFNKKSLKLIEEGKKISELKNKNLNFI